MKLIRLALILGFIYALCITNGASAKKKKAKTPKSDEDEDTTEAPPTGPMDDDPPNAAITYLQFVLSARELPAIKRGIIPSAIPDPFVALEYYPSSKASESFVYKTSKLDETANPEWPDVIKVRFVEGKGQRLKFTVKDATSKKEVAHCSTSLSKLVSAPNNQLSLELVGSAPKNGKLLINTLLNETTSDDTVDRLGVAKTKKKKLIINLDLPPPAKKTKKKEKEEDEEEDDAEGGLL